MPNSALKYAIIGLSTPEQTLSNQVGPSRYAFNFCVTRRTSPRKPSFSDNASSLSCETLPRSLTGLCPQADHRLLSIRLNKSIHSGSHDQKTFCAINPRSFRASGRAGKTVKLRTLGIFHFSV